MAEVSPKVVLPALLLVAVAGAWMVMPSTDTGGTVAVKPKPKPVDPFAAAPAANNNGSPPGWVAAEPPPPEVAQAIEKYKREGMRRDRPWEAMRTKLKAMDRMQSGSVGAAVGGGGREAMLRVRAENHLANAGGNAREAINAWMDESDYPDKVQGEVGAMLDGMEDQLDKIDQALADGTLAPDMAMRKAEMVQDSTLRKVEKLTEGDVPDGVAKSFSTPPVPKPPPKVPADAEVPPDGWWEGEPLNWE